MLSDMYRCLSIFLICLGATSTGAEFGRNQASVTTVLLKLGDTGPVGFKAILTARVEPKAAPQQTARAATGIKADMAVVMNEAARFVGNLYGDEWPSDSTVDFSLSDDPHCRTNHLDRLHSWFANHGRKPTRKAT